METTTADRTASEIAESVRTLAKQTGNREIVERADRFVSGALFRGDVVMLLKIETNLTAGLGR